MYYDEIPQVMFSTFLGIISLRIGLNIIKSPISYTNNIIKEDRSSVIIFLFITIIFHLYYWYWRINNGFFFTHGQNYIPIANIETGIRDKLGESVMCVPLVVLSVVYRNVYFRNRIALYLFLIYSALVIVFSVLSGQIRSLFLLLLITFALLVYMLNINKLYLRRIAVVVFLFFVSSVFIVYALRYSASRLYETENNFTGIIYNLPNVINETQDIKEDIFEVQSSFLFRIFMTQELFFNTVRSLNENSNYGYGIYTINNLMIIIPRLLWPEKGNIDDVEEIIQENILQASPMDLALTPLTQYYAEGNIIGVFIGFFLLGIISSFAHKICFSIKNRIAGLVCWVIIIWSILQFENNIPVELFLGIRNGVLLMAMYYIILEIKMKYMSPFPVKKYNAL